MTDEQQLILLLSDPSTQRKGFEMLVRQYSEKLYWMIRRIIVNHDDANDVLQNTFLKAWNALGEFQGESQLATWLSRIAINASLDFLRSNNHTYMSTDEKPSLTNALMADPYFAGSDIEALFQEAIAALPDVQRTVFNLRYYEDVKYSEMSKMLGTSEGSLKASYHIAVKKISEYLKAHN